MKRRIIYTLALVIVALQAFSTTYTYDNLNRLKKVVYDNGITVTYSYDALGNRISKKVTGSGTLRGDVNGDGKVNVSDVSALINMIMGFTPMDVSRGDVNGDGKVNVSDVSALINMIMGFTSKNTIRGDVNSIGKVNESYLTTLVNMIMTPFLRT